jgi:uncharacterized protein (TIGR00369 family)
MTLAVTEDELRQLLVELPFINQYGFRLHSIGDGTCTLDVPFQETWERPGGIVSGPVLMAVADVAMWMAIMTRIGNEAEMTLTIEMKTAFLTAAKREDVRCTATILKLGKRLVYGVAECITSTGVPVTHHSMTYLRPGVEQHTTEPKID